ncbi:protein of unknown function (plasmid) [Pararobbsia alpina]
MERHYAASESCLIRLKKTEICFFSLDRGAVGATARRRQHLFALAVESLAGSTPRTARCRP